MPPAEEGAGWRRSSQPPAKHIVTQTINRVGGCELFVLQVFPRGINIPREAVSPLPPPPSSAMAFRSSSSFSSSSGHHHPTTTWDWPLQREDVKVRNFCDRFEVTLDMHYFKPREIDVKVAGNEVVIHCRREVSPFPSGPPVTVILYNLLEENPGEWQSTRDPPGLPPAQGHGRLHNEETPRPWTASYFCPEETLNNIHGVLFIFFGLIFLIVFVCIRLRDSARERLFMYMCIKTFQVAVLLSTREGQGRGESSFREDIHLF